MRLLFRHIRRSVLAAPKESLVLCLTVFLSALLFVFSTEVYIAVQAERKMTHEATYGSADLALAGLSENGTRFVSASALSEVAEDVALSLGVLSLPITMGDADGLAGALDLSDADRLFRFSFTEVTPISEEERASAVYVTEAFAEENRLSVGQEIRLTVLGVESAFTVRGIQKFPFLNRYSLLLEIESVLRILSEVSPAFLIFDGENMPYTDMYVKLNAGVSPGDAADRINDSLAGENAYAYSVAFQSGDYVGQAQDAIFIAELLAALLISAVFTVFSLRILSEKREKELMAFRLAGMTEKGLFLAFSLEVLLYLVLGTAAGLLASYFVLPAVFSDMTVYVPIALSSFGVVAGAAFELLVGVSALLVHQFLPKREKKATKNSRLPFLLFLGALLIVSLLTLIMPVAYRYLAALLVMVLVIFALLFGVPLLLQLLSGRLSPLFVRGKRRAPGIYLAMKNNGAISEMRHLHCILSIVLALCVIPVSGVLFSNGLLAKNEEQIRATYMVSGIGVAPNAVSGLEGTQAVTGGYLMTVGLDSGQTVILTSAEDTVFLSDLSLSGGTGPTGNGIYLAPATAARIGASLGDTVTVYMQKSTYEFVLTGYTSENSLYAYINAEDMGFVKQMLFVEGDASPDYLERLTRAMAFSGAFVQPLSSSYASFTAAYQVFAGILEAYLFLFSLLAFVGCANLVYVGYCRRLPHFRSLSLTGMTRGDISRMIAAEALLLLAAALAVGTLCGTCLLGFFDLAIRSFGYSLFF